MPNNIKALRQLRGMSMAELADTVGIRPPTIYKYEHDICSPSLSTAGRLAQALHCSMGQLMGLEPIEEDTA